MFFQAFIYKTKSVHKLQTYIKYGLSPHLAIEVSLNREKLTYIFTTFVSVVNNPNNLVCYVFT